jgi:1-acyl-sn-glycerol-3-phosphate acyltransferase
MLVMRSALFSVGMVITTLLFAIPAVFTYPLPYRWRYGFISQWAKFNIWWLGVTCKLRYEIQGLEHLPRRSSIVLCKHQSAWETLALQLFLPPQVWVLKRELLFVPFFGWGLAMLEPIAINRGSKKQAMQQVLEQGRERLEKGRWVVVFPEGTRVAPGQKGNYRLGGARLGEHTRHPVVPIAHNAGEFWRRRSFIKRPGIVQVRIGPAIDTAGLTSQEIQQRAVDWIEDEMIKITGAAFRGGEDVPQAQENF